jgi:uncharacterized surface protein with fasciclin (FAS1) repeats
LKLVALGVAAAFGSAAALAQEPRDPSPIERDRAAVSENDSLESDAQLDRQAQDTLDRQAQERDSERDSGISASQRQPGQPDEDEQFGSQRQAGQQQPGQEDGQLRASQSDASETDASQTFKMITDEHDNLATFVEAIKAAGLEDSLTDSTEYTVFAPTDEAFEAMGKSKEELLDPNNREELIALLRAHIVADDVDPTMARNLAEARTIDGGTLDLSSEGEELMVGDATVVESDIQEGSLRVYAIDQVLEANAPAQAAVASPEQDRQPGEQPAASARDRGEQPAAAVRERESDLATRDGVQTDEDEDDSLLN